MEITKEDEKKFAILYERYMEKKNKEEFEALRKKVAKINEVNKMAEEIKKECDIRTSSVYMNGTSRYFVRYRNEVRTY